MRILLRSAKDPLRAVSPEACLAQNLLGTNAGNLLFAQAVHRTLAVPGSEIVSDSYLTQKPGTDPDLVAGRINDAFDAFVVPLANAFRPAFATNLEQLTAVIRRLRIPVVVVGVGAQISGEDGTAPAELAEPVTEFVSAVLDRSARIGVRGEITQRYLADLGFGDQHVEVIGCPSLFDAGPELRVHPPTERLSSDSRFTMSVTPSVPLVAPIVEHHTAAYPRMVFVAQHNDRLALMLWGEDPDSVPDPRMPVHTGHRLYREDRMRFFVDPVTWVDYMAGQAFAFGTRIHGNIAALLAGTPAYVLTFDSRTQELADYHQIPSRPIRSLPADVDAADLLESADYTGFNRAHPELFASYLGFLERNGLDHTYASGDGGREFDRRLREVDFPPPVHTPFAAGEEGREQVMARLRWLRQGRAGDQERRRGRYDAPFAPGPEHQTSVQQLANENAQLRRRLTRQTERLDQLSRRLDRQAKRLRRLAAAEEARRASSWRSRVRRLIRRGD